MLKESTTNLVKEIAKGICYVKGHSWQYKDYSNWIKPSGENYDFKAVRTCKGCKRIEYLYDDWKMVEQKQTYYDVISDRYASKKL